MDLWSTIRLLFRRWYAILPVGLAFMVIAVLVLRGIPYGYQANASMVVLAPEVPVPADASQAVNPYLAFDGSEEIVASVLVTIMDSSAVRQTLQGDGVGPQWSFIVRGIFGPVLQLSAQEASPQAAVRSANQILEVARSHLAEAQVEGGAPPSLLLRLSVLSSPHSAIPLVGSKIRVLVGIGVVGLILGIGAAYLAEGSSRRRRDKNGRGGQSDEDSDSQVRVLVST